MPRGKPLPEPLPEAEVEIDLHGCPPDQALRRLSNGLHGARIRGADRVLVITGRGWGNLARQPVLRGKVEAWLRGPEGQRHGVLGYEIASKGGALLVKLRSARQP